MTSADHIKAFRLFELSRAESIGKDFQLEELEKEHLQRCVECRGVVEVFERQFEGRFMSSSDTAHKTFGNPQFSVGDQIEIVGPSELKGKVGVVESVVNPTAGDFVYRYRVRFVEGGSNIFFGFELGRAA